MQTVKISPKSVEISGFPPLVNYLVLALGAIALVASFWLVPKAVKGSSGARIAVIVIGALLFFFVGTVWDRWTVTSTFNEKVETAKQESRGELPRVSPAAPDNLTASPVSSSQINLSWADNSDTEEGFKIERRLGAAGTYAPLVILGPNATSYADSGLAPESNPFYRIKAFNSDGESQYSREVTGTTSAATLTSDASNWSNPALWYRYVILPVLATLCVTFLTYLFFRYLQIRQYWYQEMEMKTRRRSTPREP